MTPLSVVAAEGFESIAACVALPGPTASAEGEEMSGTV